MDKIKGTGSFLDFGVDETHQAELAIADGFQPWAVQAVPLFGQGWDETAGHGDLAPFAPHAPILPPTVFTIFWNVDADGNWSTHSDWSLNRLPNSTDDVGIDTADLHTVTFSTGTATVHTLTVGDDNFVVSGGSLTTTAGASFAHALTVSGGTLALGSNAVTVSGLFTDTGGTIFGTGTLTLAGGSALNGDVAIMTGSGTTVLQGTTTISGYNYLYVEGGRTIENQGTITATPGVNDAVFLGLDGSTLQNDVGATINFNNGLNTRGAGVYNEGGTNTFTNAGLVENTGSGTGNFDTQIQVAFTNTGTLAVNAGELSLNGGGSSTGTITVASGAILDFHASSSTAFAMSGTETINGTLEVDGGVLNLGGALSIAGALTTTGGTLALGSNNVTVSGLFTDTGGTISGTGTLTLAGGSALNGDVAIMTGSGTTVLQGTTTISGYNYLYVEGGRTIENQGTITATPGVNDAVFLGLDGSTLQNDVGATINFNNGLNTRGAGVYNEGGTNTFTNAGLVENTGSGTGNFDTQIQVAFTNTGTLAVNAGELSLNGGGSSTGTITVASGAILDFHASSSTAFTMSGTETINGTLEVDGGVLNLGGALSIAGALTTTGGTLALGSNNVTVSGLFTDTGGTISGTGTLTLAGGSVFGGSGDGIELMTGTGKTVLQGTTTISGYNYLYADGGRTIENQGTLTITPGSNRSEIVLGQNPNGSSLGGGTLQNDASGTINFNNVTGTSFGVYNALGTNTFTNAGLVENTGSGTGTHETQITVAFTNTGTLAVNAGEVALNGGGSSTGTITVASGALLDFDANGSTAFTMSGTQTINGSLEVDGGVLNTAALMVGQTLTVAGGTLNLGGALSIAGALTTTGGTLALGSNNVTVSGLFTDTGGTISGTGTLTLAGGSVFGGSGDGIELMTGTGKTVLQGTTTISGYNYLYADGGRTIENQGTLTITPGSNRSEIVLGQNPNGSSLGGGTLQNDASGTINFNNVTGTSFGVYNALGTNTFTNAGLVENTGSGTGTHETQITVAFTNTGTLAVNAGEVALNGGGSSTGTITVASGALLDFNGASSSTFILNGGASGAGTSELDSGTLSVTNATTIGTKLSITSGTLALGDNLTVSGNFTDANSVVSGAGTLTLSGGTDTINGSSTFSVANLATSNGAQVTINENLSYGGALSEAAGTTLNMGTRNLNLSGVGSSIAGTISGSGTLIFSGGSQTLNSGATLTISNWTTSGSDATSVNASLTYGSHFTDGAGTTLAIASGDTLTLSGAATFAGSVSGAGTLALSSTADSFNSGATVSVANLAIVSGAQISINEALSYGGALSEATGTALSLGSNTLSLSGTGSSIAGTISGTGTLALSGGSQSLNSGASLSIAHWTTSGSDTASINENLTYTGAFSGGSGTTLTVASGDTLALTGGVTLAGAVSGAGTLALSGNTIAINAGASFSIANISLANGEQVSINENLSYGGALLAATGTALTIASGDTFTLSGASTLAGTVAGVGTLALGGGSQALNSGVSLTVANWSTSGADAANVNTNLSYVGVFNAGAGTTLAIASGVTFGLSGAATLAGTVSGAGTLSFTGGTDALNSGAAITAANWSISGTDTTAINENLSFGGTFTDGSGTTLTVSSGDNFALSGASTFAGTVAGTGTLALAGGTVALNTGTSLSVANMSISNGAQVSVNTGLVYGGVLAEGSGTSLALGANTLTLSGSGSSIAGAISGSGTLALTGGSQVLNSGASLAISNWTTSGSDAVSLNESLTYSGTFSDGAGTTLTIATGDTFTLNGAATLVGAIGGTGTLTLTGGNQSFNSGAALTAARWTMSGSDAVSVNENLTYGGTFSNGAGTTLTIASGDTLTLTGASTFAGSVGGAGTLTLSGGTDHFNAGTSVTAANLTIANAAKVAAVENLSYGGVLSQASGTIFSLGTNTLTLTGAGSSIAGTISGTGTLAFAGGSQALNAGAILGIKSWTTSNNDAATINANLKYVGAFSAGAGTALTIGSGDTFTLGGASTLAGTIAGAGKLVLAGHAQTLNSGAVLTVSSVATLHGDQVILNESLSYGGTFTEGVGTTLTIASGDTLALSGTSTFVGTTAGAGALILSGGTDTFKGGHLTVASVTMSDAAQVAITKALTFGGTFTEAAGTSLFIGANVVLSGTGSTFSGSLKGAGTLVLSGGSQAINTGALVSVSNWTMASGDTVSLNENLKYAGNFIGGAGTTLTVGSSDTLTFSSTAAFNGTLSGAGTLAFAGGSQSFTANASLSVSNWKMSAGDAVSLIGSLSYSGAYSEGTGTSVTIAAAKTFTLSGTSTIAGSIGGSGTLAFAGGSQTVNAGATFATSNWAISGTDTAGVNESLTYAGKFSAVSGTTLSIGTGDTLTLSGASTFGGTVNGAGTVAVANGTLQLLTLGGTDNLEDTGVIQQTGNIQLGDATSKAATLTIDATGSYEIENSRSIAQGTSNASVIVDNGLFIKTADAGISHVSVAMTDNGVIEVAGGTLDLMQAVSGTGTMTIDANAVLELDSSTVASLQTIMNGSNATLALSAPSSFGATISGFAASDTIDLLKIKATAATLQNGDQLLITNGHNTVATLQLSGDYTGDTFSVASDGHGGTSITTNAQMAAVIAVETGDWLSVYMEASGQSFASTGQHTDVAILAGTMEDTFNFGGQFGNITIAGYTPGHDTLNFDHHDFADVAALEAHATQNSHGDTVITLDAHDIITLNGVSLSQFEAHSSDWHFI